LNYYHNQKSADADKNNVLLQLVTGTANCNQW